MTTKQEILEFIRIKQALFSDGAMGTVLRQRLPVSQSCLDCANLTHPDIVASVHNDYLSAGSDMIQTNTFGANRFKLNAHGVGDQLREINRAGVEIARRSVQTSGRSAFIAGGYRPIGCAACSFWPGAATGSA